MNLLLILLSPIDLMTFWARYGNSTFLSRSSTSVGSACWINSIHMTTWSRKDGLVHTSVVSVDLLQSLLNIYFLTAASRRRLLLSSEPLLIFHIFGRNQITHLMSPPGSTYEILWSIFLFFLLGISGWLETNAFLRTRSLMYLMLFSLSRIISSSILSLLSRKN